VYWLENDSVSGQKIWIIQMRNCFMLGSGRSGTSMLAGLLHQAGYFMGDKLHKPLESNPKGFFEWMIINQINEQILAGYARENLIGKLFKMFLKKGTVHAPIGRNQKWLLSLPKDVDVQNYTPQVETQIKEVLAKEPFGYKDPRFSYTLPVWKKFLKPDTVFICVFREPDVTVNSILKECRTREYLGSLYINRRMAYGVWFNIYSHILFKHAKHFENFIFVHYDQVYHGTALPMLSRMLGVPLKKDFVDEDLKRTVPGGSVPGKVKELYERLCEAANYREGIWN
jgi:hypothetical protein